MDPLCRVSSPEGKHLRRGPSTPTSQGPFTSFDDVHTSKKPGLSPPIKKPTFLRHRQLRHFLSERSPSPGPDISSPSQQNSSSTGIFTSALLSFSLACFAEKRKIHWSRGKEKEHISSSLLFISC
ncbi:hypothetical protein AVEN_90009-1 [Araneus ventricosus]|uniref:Uncharacterized protein n=1 Tax=Araneus ventricosus TaxID=182803 RepID=A0A4Y2DD05_ARAVE|nr:hypothetical protein AVEN_90009-1 [Araneus ventricosus]